MSRELTLNFDISNCQHYFAAGNSGYFNQYVSVHRNFYTDKTYLVFKTLLYRSDGHLITTDFNIWEGTKELFMGVAISSEETAISLLEPLLLSP